MTRIITALTAAALLAGTASIASAERYEPAPSTVYGSQIEVPAGKILNSKDLTRRGLSANDTINVTLIPAGPVETTRSGNH